MPELPDLEAFRRYVDATALHQPISGVQVKAPAVLKDIGPEELRRELVGNRFQSTARYGKRLFSGLEDDRWLTLHFGMTGELKYFRDLEDEPEYDRLLISFQNGYHLAYLSRRKLGEVRLIEDWEDFVQSKDLGPDALDLQEEDFFELLSDRRGMIKSALMDQQLIAGIGNIYSDEILFQAGVHPRAQVQDLRPEVISRIFASMQEALQEAIADQANPTEFPPHYLTPHRGPEEKCPRCETPLEKIKVSGRGAYFCPACQGAGGQ